MDIGKLVGHLISVALILGALGLLRVATLELKKEAVYSRSPMMSLGAFNRSLQRGQVEDKRLKH